MGTESRDERRQRMTDLAELRKRFGVVTGAELAQEQGEAWQSQKPSAPESTNRGADNRIKRHSKSVSFRQSSSSSVVLATSAVDFLVLSCAIRWQPESIAATFAVLDRAQTAARDSDEAPGRMVDVGGLAAAVGPSGAAMGCGYMAWIVQVAGASLAIQRKDHGEPDRPNVIATFPGACVSRLGLLGVWDLLTQLVESLGGVVECAKVSRVDPCCDVVGCTVQELYDLIDGGYAVTRAKKLGTWKDIGEPMQTIYVGAKAAPCKLRIYDKLAEVDQNGDDWEYLVEHRWGGQVPKVATRVEFQCRRDFLRTFEMEGGGKIDTFQDLCESLGALVEYLVTKWFRIAERVDKENTEKIKAHATWERIAEGFRVGFACAMDVKRVTKQIVPAGEGLIRQAIGCMVSALAQYEFTPEQFLASCQALFDRVIVQGIGAKRFAEKLLATRLAYLAAHEEGYTTRKGAIIAWRQPGSFERFAETCCA